MLHEHWAQAYKQTLTPERRAQSQVRPTEGMLDQIFALDDAPLEASRAAERRAVGVCRHFSVLAVAALRTKNTPARARCGFGTYFKPGRYVDHWVVECWSGARWIMADFQIDPVQRATLKLDFDPMDMPPGKFVIAGEAWQLCRSGKADAAKFGIFDVAGLWFIAANLVRDLASLNKVEMLPWDVWGPMTDDDARLDCDLLDRLAELTISADACFEELRALYDKNASLSVTTRVFNASRRMEEAVWT